MKVKIASVKFFISLFLIFSLTGHSFSQNNPVAIELSKIWKSNK